MPHQRWSLIPGLLLAWSAANADVFGELERAGHPGLDLRYRYEGVEQQGKPLTADANTLRIRLNFATREFNGFSGLLELDHIEAIGGQHYDDTRNGLTDYPVVTDPEGTDLNQAWLQYAFAPDTRLRLGRQRINYDNQRFVGASDWRQNEQTFDSLRFETTRLPGVAIDYAFVDQVRRVFGPDAGTPPSTLDGATHLFNLKLTKLPVGTVVAYGYFLDFNDAPQLSSRTAGVRYEGGTPAGKGLTFGWALEYARQQDVGNNPIQVDAHYGLLELHLKTEKADFFAGNEILSGEDAGPDPVANAAFQTPLATLHKWQGWADKFLVTPPAGIEDSYVGFSASRSGWSVQAVWHDFSADATGSHYGSELDFSASHKFAQRYSVLLKFADYQADNGFTDTQKVWMQLGATF